MPVENMTIYNKEAPAFTNCQVEKIASGFRFTEGPVWHADGYLLFSDTPG